MSRQILALLWGLALLLALLPAPAHSQETCATDVTVRSGDTLSRLAAQYLDGPQAYPAIVQATNAQAGIDPSYATIDNPNVIAVGWKLCVPGTAVSEPVNVPEVDPPFQGEIIEEQVDSLVARAPTLAVDLMRARTYPGSALVIEETLASGSNYSRYLVSYRSEGLKIYALLTVPMGERPPSGWPVVVFNHGYIQPTIYRSTERYVAYVDAFARNGYIVLRPDYRGHGNSEGEPSSAYAAPDYTVDVLNAVASIQRYQAADPERIGMWGHSMGGTLTLRSMVTTGDVKAGVIWAGVVADYAEMLERWNSRRSELPSWIQEWQEAFRAEYGSPQENPAFWNAISPNAYLSNLSGPIQLHHGAADTSVPVEYSHGLAAQIEAAGGEVEIYTYEGDDHNISRSFNTAMARSVAFFDRHVKGEGG